MKWKQNNFNFSINVSLTALRFAGFWAPDNMEGTFKMIYYFFTGFSFMFLLGIYLIIQVVDMFLIWGDLHLMTGTAFLLFTNLAQTSKIAYILTRRTRIDTMIREADAVLKSEVGEGQDIAKRYPYDTTKSPAYELTYCHQVGALFIAAYLNVAKDTLVISLIAQTKCRLELLGLALTKIHEDLGNFGNMKLTPEQERKAETKLRSCVLRHQAALEAAKELQYCFSAPTFAQFAVSMVIICVTAFQLAAQTKNMVRLISMGTYLLNMAYQVFIYCYQGTDLQEQSISVAGKAYECSWYSSSVKFRKSLLYLMIRTRRPISLTAGGFTTISIPSFMAIIKASYSFFTLLKQVEEKV